MELAQFSCLIYFWYVRVRGRESWKPQGYRYPRQGDRSNQMQRSVSAGQVSEGELDAILVRYGDAKSGTLTQAEGAVLRMCVSPMLAGTRRVRGNDCPLETLTVRTAFGSMGLPMEYADRVFKSMDLKQAGTVSRSDLKLYVSRKIKRLRAAFTAVDR